MRPLWFLAGTAAGVYATAKARRAAEALTVDGVHDRLTGWFAGARVLGEELRAGAAVKESQLRDRLREQAGPRALSAESTGTRSNTGMSTGMSTGTSRVAVEGEGDH